MLYDPLVRLAGSGSDCVDIAMGSGHCLVAAVDRIEARLLFDLPVAARAGRAAHLVDVDEKCIIDR